MNLNRDEFLLLSRTGRGPHSTRAGPGPDERFEAELTVGRRGRRARSGLTLRSGAGRGLRHVLGPRSGRSAGASRTPGRIDEGTYFEMEFVVGFPAEEETLR
ncbi:MAG TPA: hypothetical protein VHW96_20140 [Solirubrobacteraceae bacterium]|jgi:hypothetical protein|nr:hypothetical protein [Solirubrobacteraceae bacterium]